MELSVPKSAPQIDINNEEEESPVNFGPQIEISGDSDEEKKEVKVDSIISIVKQEKADFIARLPTIAISEVEKHKAKDDMWSSVEGLVYELTSFIPKHPGGKQIMKGAGMECTDLFNQFHEGISLQDTMVAKLCIGRLCETEA